MATFAADTPIRVMIALDWPVTSTNLLVLVEGGLSRILDVASRGGTVAAERLITTVESYLSTIEAFDRQLLDLAPKDTMIQADVVKWADNTTRSAGVQTERERYRLRLLRLLDLQDNSLSPNLGSAGSAGSVRLGRS